MSKKEVIYQGLIDLPVQIEDESIASPDYFRVTRLPSEFTSGKNILKFKGNPSLFNEGQPIYIEILDSNGEPIYYEIGLDRESAQQAAVITVFINEDTAPGNGLVIICGTAQRAADGRFLNTAGINVRWTAPVFIDPSKSNNAEIIFEKLPIATISASTGSYTNLGYANGGRIFSQSVDNLEYYFYNNTPVLITGSKATTGFINSALSATVTIPYTSINSIYPTATGTVSASAVYTSSISSFNGKGIAFLTDQLIFPLLNSNSDYAPSFAALTASITYEQSASLASEQTENTYNIATVYFTGLQPQIGVVEKIRSYVKSSGVGEYILSNETDISGQATEFGFTADVVTASFALPTVHRNDKLDFKFEFVNPAGMVSKQTVELLNNMFIGGNTYIGGNDNLLTGSLFVAGATGTGVEITGKANSAMVRSLGYQGFQNAITNNGGQYAGFVIYSGSIQTILGAAESYSGVGLELVANTSSYFKYASANGGLLDIRTNSFYLGSNTSYISSSGGNLVIRSDNFFLGNSSSYVASLNQSMSIYSSNFTVSAAGRVTASAILVTKTPAGSYPQIMIDTTNGILDATNLGRTVYSNNSEITYGPSNVYAANTYTLIPSLSFVFQGLKNEYRYTVYYQMQLTSDNLTSIIGSGTRFKLYTINSGSNAYDQWTLIATKPGPGLSINGQATTLNSIYSEDFLENDRRIDVSGSLNSSNGKMFRMTIEFYVTNSDGLPIGGGGTNLTVKYRDFNVVGSRGLVAARGGFAVQSGMPPTPSGTP